MNRIVILTLGLSLVSTTALALTLKLEVSPAEVRDHPKEWSVQVDKKENGLIEFRIVRTLSEPKYLVAHLEVHHGGKLIAESSTPVYGKTKGNTFYFSISVEDLAESRFDLSESGFSNPPNDDIPEVGGNLYQFRLRDFAPADLVKPAIKP